MIEDASANAYARAGRALKPFGAKVGKLRSLSHGNFVIKTAAASAVDRDYEWGDDDGDAAYRKKVRLVVTASFNIDR
jgi:hypothetical protein